MIRIIDAILAIKSDAQVTVHGNDVENIIWHEATNITNQQILDKQTELQAEHDAQEYARNRQAEYPSIDELIVALWEGVVEERMASVTELEGLRQAVKDKYPKPE